MSPSKTEHEFEALLEYMRRNRGFDFTGYKRPSLVRRIQKRMDSVHASSYSEYQDYLELHAEEFAALFNTILINVTAFFRDAASWEYLAKSVLPTLLAPKRGNAPIRVWSAGCASGEEAYTLAILFAEQLGLDAFRDRVKIYATDLDEHVLIKARHGAYSATEMEDVPEPLRKKYFDRADGTWVFRRDMRRQIIFGRHDLIHDAPISRIDLLVCRNTLMYLNAETQAKILARFHFALTDGGVLFLGRAETLLMHARAFEPLDLKRRMSTKIPRGELALADRLTLLGQNDADDPANASQQHRVRDMALDVVPMAHVLVDASGTLAQANERARMMFALTTPDIGRPVQDLKVSYSPVDLRSLIDRARAEHRPVVLHDVEWQANAGDLRYLDIHVVSLSDAGAYVGSGISFTDVSGAKRLQRDLEHARQELETAYEELQSTNEELETTNEELQSTVEELETTNEELQATNEELTTMNEELQATNEELTTLNDETRRRGEQLNDANVFLESVLSSIEGAVVVVDRDLLVIAWSQKAKDLWGLQETDVIGKHFLGLDIGLPVAALRAPLKQVLASRDNGATTLELDAVNGRGRPLRCRVSVSHLRNRSGEPRGAILVMDDVAGGSASRGNGSARS